MKRFVADLHIHTCLSPCAELDMTPRRIIDAAIKKGLDIIAISDHNSAENIEAAMKIAGNTDITVLPAMEITSYEEAHVLAIFRSSEDALKMQEIVYAALPDYIDQPESSKLHGYQLVVNENDEIMEFNRRFFFGATSLSVKNIVDTVHNIGGIAVASHIDRESFSVISQLGIISEDMEFDAIEISRNTGRERAEARFREYAYLPFIASSDAHHLNDVGRRTTAFFLEEISFDEIMAALKGKRRIEWE